MLETRVGINQKEGLDFIEINDSLDLQQAINNGYVEVFEGKEEVKGQESSPQGP